MKLYMSVAIMAYAMSLSAMMCFYIVWPKA